MSPYTKKIIRNIEAKQTALVALVIMALMVIAGISSMFIITVEAGTTVTVDDTINNVEATSNNNGRRMVHTSNGTLVVCYTKLATKNNVYVARSYNGGTTWADVKLTSFTANNVYAASIAIDSTDKIWLVHDVRDNAGTYRIYYYTSTDCGKTWSGATNIGRSGGGVGYAEYEPSIAVDSSDNVHVVWYLQNTSYQIGYRYWNGAAWSSLRNLTSGASYDCRLPSICIDDSDNIHVGYLNTTGDNSICYRKYSGGIWGTEKRFAATGSNQESPSIACDGGYVYLAFDGTYTGSSVEQIRVVTSANSGATWGSIVNVTADSFKNLHASIMVNKIHDVNLVWMYYGGVTYGVRWANSTDCGATWNKVNFTAPADFDYPNLLWANYPTVSGNKTNVPSQGYCFVYLDRTGTDFVKYWIDGNLSWNVTVTPPWSSSYSIKGLPLSGLVDWSGYANQTVWCNTSGTYSETLEINMSINASDNVTEIRVWVGDIDDGLGHTIGAGNISVQFSKNNVTWGSNVRTFTNLGSNITINKTLYIVGNGCYGTNPFNGVGLTSWNTSLYVRFKLSIPIATVAGTYESVTATSWKIYIGYT